MGAPLVATGSSIIVCDQPFDIGHPVVTFRDPNGFNAGELRCLPIHGARPPCTDRPWHPFGKGGVHRFRERRSLGGDRSLSALQNVVRQFVLHHDGCASSAICFNVLHNERGLSVHFLIDNDGTIYQTLDLRDCAFHAEGANETSVGVEICNAGDAYGKPTFYKNNEREKVTIRVHGHQFLAYSYVEKQYEAMIALGRALARILPNLPQDYPHDPGSDDVLWTDFEDARNRRYCGYLGHFHLTRRKWDPGAWDFKRFCSSIRGRISFPLALAESGLSVPGDQTAAEMAAETFYDNNEQETRGGFFPVGPFGGESRLWHGGAHFSVDQGTPVYAPFAGRVVAARLTDDCDIGSRNYVLIKHSQSVAGKQVIFFSLYYHLTCEMPGKSDNVPVWLRSAEGTSWVGQVGTDEGALLSVEVNSGDLIGHAGEAGPPGEYEGQFHFQIFAGEELGEKLQPGFWTVIDGSNSGHLCQAKEILDLIDRPGAGGQKDGALSRGEFQLFFRGSKRDSFHKVCVYHLSEWGEASDWLRTILQAKDFAHLPEPKRRLIVQRQIEPVLFWTDELSMHAGLPPDRMIYDYHPVTFVVWMARMLGGGGARSEGIQGADKWENKPPPKDISDDFDDTNSANWVDDEDTFGIKVEGDQELSLSDLVAGYGD